MKRELIKKKGTLWIYSKSESAMVREKNQPNVMLYFFASVNLLAIAQA